MYSKSCEEPFEKLLVKQYMHGNIWATDENIITIRMSATMW